MKTSKHILITLLFLISFINLFSQESPEKEIFCFSDSLSEITPAEFLEKNKLRENVVTMRSGIQYIITQEGYGMKPRDDDGSFIVEYTGYLQDGTIFDSSEKQGGMVELDFESVVKGMAIMVRRMNIGSKCIVYIPPAYGYGKRGLKDIIPPNSLLIFEIELFESR